MSRRTNLGRGQVLAGERKARRKGGKRWADEVLVDLNINLLACRPGFPHRIRTKQLRVLALEKKSHTLRVHPTHLLGQTNGSLQIKSNRPFPCRWMYTPFLRSVIGSLSISSCSLRVTPPYVSCRLSSFTPHTHIFLYRLQLVVPGGFSTDDPLCLTRSP